MAGDMVSVKGELHYLWKCQMVYLHTGFCRPLFPGIEAADLTSLLEQFEETQGECFIAGVMVAVFLTSRWCWLILGCHIVADLATCGVRLSLFLVVSKFSLIFESLQHDYIAFFFPSPSVVGVLWGWHGRCFVGSAAGILPCLQINLAPLALQFLSVVM